MVETRSGLRTKVTRNILAVSLVLAIIAFAGALGFGYRKMAKTGADEIRAENMARNGMP